MHINFKWNVGDKVKVPLYGKLTEVEIISRVFVEDSKKKVIEYETNLFHDPVIFTQEELEQHN